MLKLSVNVDHIATLREARKSTYPDPVAAAILAELAGASGITVHLREDRRHIKERDVEILRQTQSDKLSLRIRIGLKTLLFCGLFFVITSRPYAFP